MPVNITTFSFKDSSLAISSPVFGAFAMSGQLGLDQFSIIMDHDRTVHEVASDGAIMVSYLPGDNGAVELEMLQTCLLNAFLVSGYNLLKSLADSGNVSNWATASIMIRNSVDGSTHVFTGVSFGKLPDKVYSKQGQKITWRLAAADIQTMTIGVPVA